MSATPDAPKVDPDRAWFWCVWTMLVVLFGALEVSRLLEMLDNHLSVALWLSFWDLETTLPFVLLLCLPVLIRYSKPRTRVTTAGSETAAVSAGKWQTPLSAVIVFCVSLACSAQIGRQPVTVATPSGRSQQTFAELPPAYHDEYSYLLQAETFWDGRLSYPPQTVRPDLFHQFHVLNEYRTVSRYFPWTGMWMAPFHAIGHAVWGHWLAGALAAAVFYLALRQVVSQSMAFTGGLLIAVSPGLALFSNLLLAHHPTLLALSLFTWAFFRMQSRRQLRFAFLAGTALTLAMLARPMTAAGFGLPFGIWFAGQLLVAPQSRTLAIGFAVPLLLGFSALAVLNEDATGAWMRTTYQEYTDRYTPRHRYGFDNVADGRANHQRLAAVPPAIQKYDSWATNLTPARAADNVWQRWKASLVWSLAIAPVLLGLLMTAPLLLGFPTAGQRHVQRLRELRLLAAAILTLHLVHIPYWFDGIMHWHYVLETAPLLLVLTAVGLVSVYERLRFRIGGRNAFLSVLVFTGAGLIPGWVALPMYNDVSKVSLAISEISYSRQMIKNFQQTIQDFPVQRPALVMVDESGTDPQLSYIINPPNQDADVLVCRLPPTGPEVQELQRAFADRTLYVFDPQTRQLSPADLTAEAAGPPSPPLP